VKTTVIRVPLSEKGITKAIQEVQAYKAQLEARIKEYLSLLVAEGLEIARAQVVSMAAYDKGELLDSLSGMMYTDGKKGIIFTDCKHAAFVEFGTGVVGEENPHPTMPWPYDTKGHGEAGWWYLGDDNDPLNENSLRDDGKRWRWTQGMPSRPFMHNTAVELEREALKIAREVFR